METPGDRIVRELEQVPHRDRMNVAVQVMRRLGMTSDARTQPMGRTGKMCAAAGVAALALGAGVLVAHVLMDSPQGWLELTTSPEDALIFIDGRQVGEPQPGPRIHRAAGPHTLTVTSPGYFPSDQNIELSAKRPLRLHVKLEVAPMTGLEITSEPNGLVIWLDGRPMAGPAGPVRTDFRAEGIRPGPHMLELQRGGDFPAWQKGVMVEPNQITRVHAIVGD